MRRPPPRHLGIAAVLLFLLYGLNFLQFFIDDEGIPFVFAQNLLQGLRGPLRHGLGS